MSAEQRAASVYASAELIKIVHGTVSGMRRAQTDRVARSPLRLVPGAARIVSLVDRSATITEMSVVAGVSAVAGVVAPIVRWATTD